MNEQIEAIKTRVNNKEVHIIDLRKELVEINKVIGDIII